MGILNRDLAQQIVSRTMGIIDRNINVMNEKGIIIGSGDDKRIDKIHDGAIAVIQKKAVVEINEEESIQMQGSKPGVNLPILFKNEIVGVVGITGNPEEVRNYGQLVKMAAEMILEQAFLMEQIQWDERIKEEIIYQLIQGEITSDPWILERAETLGISLDIPRVAILIELISTDCSEEDIRNRRKKIITVLKGLLDNNDLMAIAYSTNIILLKECLIDKENWNSIQTFTRLNSLRTQIEQMTNIKVKFAMGTYYPTLEGISKSYSEAKKALEIGQILFPDNKVYSYQDLGFPILLNEIPKNINHPLYQHINTIFKNDKKGELHQTLKVFVEENGEIKQTAERLFIHRNTLHYRLDKIKEITGKDPKKIKDLIELYTSYLLFLFRKS